MLEIRLRLLEYWNELATNPENYTQLLVGIRSDMQLCRTLLRTDVQNRVSQTVDFTDSLGRKNPAASAARLTAAISRLCLQIEQDAVSEKSLRYRYLNCTTIAEVIADDIWDLQVMLERFKNSQSSKLISEYPRRIDRLPIKPYFWAIIWFNNKFQNNQNNYSVDDYECMIKALYAEQRLGELDMLLSELKHTDDSQKKMILRIITLTLANHKFIHHDYDIFFSELLLYVRRYLKIIKSTPKNVYAIHVDNLQKLIRYRPQTPDSPWFLGEKYLLM